MDRREGILYPLHGPQDDDKEQPEEHGNHRRANENNDFQVGLFLGTWETQSNGHQVLEMHRI